MNQAAPIPRSQLLTLEKVCWVMNVSRRTATRWIEEGELGHFRSGHTVRVAPEELLRMIAARSVAARPGPGPRPALGPDQVVELWGKIEKLVDHAVQSRLEAAA